MYHSGLKKKKRKKKKRNFWRNLISSITRTRHIPVISHIIVPSAEDLSYTTTKSLRQYIFIRMSVSTLGKKKKEEEKRKSKRDPGCHKGLRQKAE